MTRRYAADTEVPVERSKAEIESLVCRYGASSFQSGWKEAQAAVGFSMRGRLVRFLLPLPSKDAPEFTQTEGRGRPRGPETIHKLWEQACRQRWRALKLAIQAKLEAVECGISEFDHEFLAFIIDPATGKTIGEAVSPELAISYQQNGRKRISLLPAPDDLKDL